MSVKDPGHLEEQKIKGAIKTDFILSAEIMTIALAAIEAPNVWMQAATLAVVAIGVTLAVYGSVALIVKMDDVGLYLAQNAPTPGGARAGAGAGQVHAGADEDPVGCRHRGDAVGRRLHHHPRAGGSGLWLAGIITDPRLGLCRGRMRCLPPGKALPSGGAKAAMDGVFGVAWGLVLIPLATKVIGPVLGIGRNKG